MDSLNASDVLLRPATIGDLPAISDIFNHYVHHSTCIYQTQPETLAARTAWFAAHGPAHPVIVAVLADQVVGWGSLSAYKTLEAYRFTVEDSVYVRSDLHRRGIGSALLARLIELAQAHQHHSIIASIDGYQTPSIALHELFGFAKVARFSEIGRKYDRWLDVVYMQRMV